MPSTLGRYVPGVVDQGDPAQLAGAAVEVRQVRTTPDVPTDVAVHPDRLERHWQVAGFRRPCDLVVGHRGSHSFAVPRPARRGEVDIRDVGEPRRER